MSKYKPVCISDRLFFDLLKIIPFFICYLICYLLQQKQLYPIKSNTPTIIIPTILLSIKSIKSIPIAIQKATNPNKRLIGLPQPFCKVYVTALCNMSINIILFPLHPEMQHLKFLHPLHLYYLLYDSLSQESNPVLWINCQYSLHLQVWYCHY